MAIMMTWEVPFAFGTTCFFRSLVLHSTVRATHIASTILSYLVGTLLTDIDIIGNTALIGGAICGDNFVALKISFSNFTCKSSLKCLSTFSRLNMSIESLEQSVLIMN